MLHPKPTPQRKRPEVPTIEGVASTMGALRRHVLMRDGRCILKRLFPSHVCRGRHEVNPWHEADFTLEHVTGVHGHLDGRHDDDEHCVGLCYGFNIDHTSRRDREAIREHLRSLFPGCRHDVGGDELVR